MGDPNSPLPGVGKPALYALATFDGAVLGMRPKSRAHRTLKADTAAHWTSSDVDHLGGLDIALELSCGLMLVGAVTMKRFHNGLQ